MDNLEIGQWPLNVSRVSLLKFVLLINMLISGVVIKMFYLGRGWGREGVVQNYFPTNAQPPLLHSRLCAGNKKRRRGEEQTNKEDNKPVCCNNSCFQQVV